MTPAREDSALFAYGSLLDARVRDRLLGRPVTTSAAWLQEYERRRRHYFYIVKSAGSRTPGLILEDLSARDFELLDRYEEVPRLYVRTRAEVIDARGETRRCWLYLPTAALTTAAY